VTNIVWWFGRLEAGIDTTCWVRKDFAERNFDTLSVFWIEFVQIGGYQTTI
jgi:hypothetical protein